MAAACASSVVDPLHPPSGVYLIRSDDFAAWIYPLGARLMQVWWLAAPGGPRPLTVGFDQASSYQQDTMSMGAVCGRYGNRIAGAQLIHGDQHFALNANHPLGHCLHGGQYGFGQRMWEVRSHHGHTIVLDLLSSDLDQGFPGNCTTTIQFEWLASSLQWTANAHVDKPCPINLIPHPYWNLDASPTIEQHTLVVNGSFYLPLDTLELPMPLTHVQGTAFDYRQPKRIVHADIAALDAAIRIDPSTDKHHHGLHHAATASVPGLALAVHTDQPFVHLYGGSGLQPSEQHLGVAHTSGAGLCVETESWPNGPALGTVMWHDADTPYRHTAKWTFTTG